MKRGDGAQSHCAAARLERKLELVSWILYVVPKLASTDAELAPIEPSLSSIALQLAPIAFNFIHILRDLRLARPIFYIAAKLSPVASEFASIPACFFAVLPELLTTLFELLEILLDLAVRRKDRRTSPKERGSHNPDTDDSFTVVHLLTSGDLFSLVGS
jgi:hypothetical protein